MRKTIIAFSIGFLLGTMNFLVPAAKADAPAYHVVKPSETLWSLAIRYGVSTEALMRTNGLVNPNWIYAGQLLAIPQTVESQEYHVVLPGETLWSISAQHGVSAWSIAYGNGIWNPDLIFVGQNLLIRRGQGCCPASATKSGSNSGDANPVSAAKVPSTSGSGPSAPKKTLLGKAYSGGAVGYDISYPQCRTARPSAPHSFAIVGINRGRAFRMNECFASLYDWAAKTSAIPPSIYMNLQYPAGETADNGLNGPAGKCRQADEACKAYNYGFNAAKFSFEYAGKRTANVWWLDVELSNTWSSSRSANSRVIQGAIDFFQNRGVTVGVYSSPQHWSEIAGTFKPKLVNQTTLPVWVFGADNRREASDFCSPANAFGGGTVWLTQYPWSNFDGNYAC